MTIGELAKAIIPAVIGVVVATLVERAWRRRKASSRRRSPPDGAA